MKNLNKKNILTDAALGLALAVLWICFSSSGHLQAAPAAKETAGHTITLTKVLEVYEFEDLKVSVDQYQVKRGDSLVKLLKSRGLSTSRQDEAKMMRLVKALNPELKNPGALEPGQLINLPSKLDEQAAAKIQETRAAETSSPPMTTETLKVYDRPQTTQQSARVVVLRHTGGQEATPPPPEPANQPAQTAPPQPAAAATSATAEPGQAQPAPAAPVYLGLDFPSGNVGPLAQEPQSQVVYRTVTIRRGDSLERLLRREGMNIDLIYHHLLKVTLQLNPEIKNPDLILAGSEIKIPAAGDYLTALAGVNPQDVKMAATAIAERRRPPAVRVERSRSRRAAVMELPAEAVVSAKSTLGLLLTRLGEKVNSQGQILIPAGSGAVELNTSDFPVLELSGGSRVVLDPGSRLPQTTVRDLARLNPPYLVFRTSKKETLEQALGRLWSLCGYYRVYTKDRAYEGGGDIRLKITADWMVWPTQEAWNAGQPLVINKARSPEQPTSPAWVSFLQDHGINVLDIYRNTLVPAAAAPAAPAELPVVNLAEASPSHLAAALARALGLEPSLSAQITLAHQPGTTVAPTLTAPLLWAKDKTKVVMEFGELPPEAVQILHQSGYTVVSCHRDDESVIDGVLAGLAVKPADSLTLTAPAGGPQITLTIKGRLVTVGHRKFFITKAALPSGLARLAEPGLTVIKY